MGEMMGGAELDLQCPICRDFFDDAVMAGDGFAYCRACITQWAGFGERSWRSPKTNEAQAAGGHPVLRGDIERDCKAKELRLRAARKEVADGGDPVLALALVHAGRPLLNRKDCAELCWDPAVHAEPYAHLEASFRGGCVDLLPNNVLAKLLRLDRVSVTFPLLTMGVLRALLRETLRRAEEARDDEETLALLRLSKTHFLWRARRTDAVEIPVDRSPDARVTGLYHRAWDQPEETFVVFVKGKGLEQPRLFLRVPLRSAELCGSCERFGGTRVFKARPPLPDDCSLDGSSRIMLAAYASETPLGQGRLLWRERRGGLPFPDTRGGGETEDEDWIGPCATPTACARVLEAALLHLPRGFLYHPVREDNEHFFETAAELGPVNELLLEAAERPAKRRR